MEVKHVYIEKPDVGYAPPKESLADLKNRWSRLHAKGISVKKWGELQLPERNYAQIEPLGAGQESALSKHEVPKDVVAFIFALLPLPDVARCRRVCRRWNECAARSSVWHAQLDAYVNRSELTRKAFVEMKKDPRWAAATLRQLKLAPLAEHYCTIPGCFRFFHEHGAQIPADAVEQTVKKGKVKN